MVESLSTVFSIIVIDLVLSGDNAVVIGMAARSLSPENRRKAIIFGGAGAIGLRILFTVLVATVLLGVSGLQAIGGVLLVYIAYKLIKPQGTSHGVVKEAGSLGEAIRTIVLADVVMSLDNILAVGAAAKGHIGLLMFGLLLSIPIILFGSELVARLLGRFPGVLYVGVFVLVHAAVAMVLGDPGVANRAHTEVWQEFLLSLALTGAIVGIVRMMERSQGEPPVFVGPVHAGDDRRGEETLVTSLGDTESRVTVRHGDESGRAAPT